jgi:hypothetical protein
MTDHGAHADYPNLAEAEGRPSRSDMVALLGLELPWLIGSVWLFYGTSTGGNCTVGSGLLAIADWFDTSFFQYNVILGCIAIAIVPLVPFFYVRRMGVRKIVRLFSEMPRPVWRAERTIIQERLGRRARYVFFFGSVSLATVSVALGVSILLFFKPVWEESQCGVAFAKGVNMLMAGPYLRFYGDGSAATPDELYRHLIFNLVSFQFGFLGAYVYFLLSMARAYFTLDLSPESFVDGTIRIAIASITALVLGFWLDGVLPDAWAPVVGFFLGFFPQRALLLLEKTALMALRSLPRVHYEAVPLSVLPGMSYAHEARLDREGFDNAQNLSHANAIDLAIRTGFSFGQLVAWIDAAWLATHLGEDYAGFVAITGVTGRQDLQALAAWLSQDGALDLLLPEKPHDDRLALRRKLRVILALLT